MTAYSKWIVVYGRREDAMRRRASSSLSLQYAISVWAFGCVGRGPLCDEAYDQIVVASVSKDVLTLSA